MTRTTTPPINPAEAEAYGTRPSSGEGGTGYRPASGPGPSASPPPPGRDAAADAKAALNDIKSTAKSTFAKVADRLGEIRDYAGYYADTKTDAIKAKVTTLAFYAVLGIVAGVVGLAALATAGVLLVSGIAHALAALFGGRVWLGELVTGLGLLLLLGVGAFVGLKVLTASTKRKLMAKYEQRHQDQRAKFGTDVLQRSREAQN
jgi:hypothetical protein